MTTSSQEVRRVWQVAEAEAAAWVPSASVLVRTRNRPELLAEALASVAAQQQDGLEVVVVNDGGCDVAAVLERAVGGAIWRLQFIHWAQGRGRSVAANALLEAARAPVLLFLDDDDWLAPAHVARLLTTLAAHPDAVAAYADVSGVRRAADGSWQEVRRFAESFDPLRLAYENFLPIHSVLFRAQAVAHGCRFDPALDAYEDWAFWLQLARVGRFVHQSGISAYYRLDASGFGVPASAADVSQAQLSAFAHSVRDVWSDEQLVALLSLFGYKHQCQQLEAELAQCKQGGQQEVQLALAQAQTQVETLRGELFALRQSTSWRITAPLRALVSRWRARRS